MNLLRSITEESGDEGAFLLTMWYCVLAMRMIAHIQLYACGWGTNAPSGHRRTRTTRVVGSYAPIRTSAKPLNLILALLVIVDDT